MIANVAVYHIDPDNFPATGPEIEKAFASAAYFIKDGRLCVENGKVVDTGRKQTFWVDIRMPENKQVMHDVREKFLKYYSLSEANYPVPESYVPNPHVIAVDAMQGQAN